MSSTETIGDCVKFGEWKSPISSEALCQGLCKSISEFQLRGESPCWIEQTYPKGVKMLYIREGLENVQWSPDDLSISNCVHEYGGGSFCLSESGNPIFTIKNGIYELNRPKENPRPILENPPNIDTRYADLFFKDGIIYAVRERHLGPEVKDVKNEIVGIDYTTGNILFTKSRADFYACPRVSPNGKYLAYIEWNFPWMNWDRTTICVEEILKDGNLKDFRRIESEYSNFGLQWNSKNELYVISDQGDSHKKEHNWNVHKVDLDNNKVSDEIELQGPDICAAFWQFGDDRPFALNDNYIVISSDNCLWVRNLKEESYKVIDPIKQAGYSVFKFVSLTKGNKIFVVASGPEHPETLIQLDLSNPESEIIIIRETREKEELLKFPISIPKLLTFKSSGFDVDGYFYPPYNPLYNRNEYDSLPPLIVYVHSGPTTHVTNSFDIKKQYFTSRGFAVFDMNYRGSTGKGRDFRNALYKQWGVVDAEDIVRGVEMLGREKLADSKKACIIGNSSSGFTALAAMIIPNNTFAGAVISYGVLDCMDLLKNTHKYEYHYTRNLIASDEETNAYLERSPLENVGKIKSPVALMHGMDDPVVPYTQSMDYYKALKKCGVYTKIKLFKNESHGFRSKETLCTAINNSYAFICDILNLKQEKLGEWDE